MTTRRALIRRPLASGAVVATIGLLIGAPTLAQGIGHPAAIDSGSCDAPGVPLVTLWDVSPSFIVDGDEGAGATVGTQSGLPVESSVTVVERSLDGLLETEHTIVVRTSEASSEPIACGEIGGVMLCDDALMVALAPTGRSTWSGTASLQDQGDGTTTVAVSIFEGPALPTDPEVSSAQAADGQGEDADDQGEDADDQGEDEDDHGEDHAAEGTHHGSKDGDEHHDDEDGSD